MAAFFKELFAVLEAYVRTLRRLFKPGYRRFIALPVFLQFLLLALVTFLAIRYSNPWLKELLEKWGWLEGDHGAIIGAVAIAVLYLIQFLLFFSVYKYLVLILLAPFLAFLSEKIEKEASGTSVDFSWSQFIRDIFRALRINLLNIIREFGLVAILSLLGLLSGLALLAPALILLVQSYFMGYGILDYNAERWRYGFRQTERWMWQHKGLTLGCGLMFHLIFAIPLVGWIFAPVWSVAAGTEAALKVSRTTTGGR